VEDGEADADAAGDLAQGLAFGVPGEDRAAFVGVDDARASAFSAAACGGVEAVAGLADDVAAPVLGQREGQVEDEAAFGVLAGGDALLEQ
jgi:hypothetical protein